MYTSLPANMEGPSNKLNCYFEYQNINLVLEDFRLEYITVECIKLSQIKTKYLVK